MCSCIWIRVDESPEPASRPGLAPGKACHVSRKVKAEKDAILSTVVCFHCLSEPYVRLVKDR